MTNRSTLRALNKFYTKVNVANSLKAYLLNFLHKHLPNEDYNFIEPSAGNGVFLPIEKYSYQAYDIEPESNNIGIIQQDYFKLNIPYSHKNIILGNPPFGKKGDLALSFLNKALSEASFVAFILPNNFAKYSIQKKINPRASLYYQEYLSSNSFLFDGKDYSVNCVFQIWSLSKIDSQDLRIKSSPRITHPDFLIYQYNCTEQSLKYFDYDWDIAILRQGWDSFNSFYTKQDLNSLNKKKQWFFIKASTPEILEKIKVMDFEKLSQLNTSVRGFGKADFVAFYEATYG